jgi:hypothetical protein
MRGWRRILAIGTLTVLTACGGGGATEGATSEPSASVSATSSEEPTSEPPVEPTEPESTGPVENKPSIKIANAPIGGNGDQGPRACADVNWLGKKPIPDGTTIKLESIHLDDPGGIFELDQGSCAANLRPCAGLEWKGGDPPACHVGAKQVAFADSSENGIEVLVILSVTVTCESQADCDSLAADPENSGGSSVAFTPDPDFGTPSGSPSESPPESPSESPPESPPEAPSESLSESRSNG